MAVRTTSLTLALTGALAASTSAGAATAPTELNRPAVGVNQNHGYAVAVSGDTAVSGIPYFDGPIGADQGAIAIHRWNGSTWALEDIKTSSDVAAGDQVGISVAIDGDTLVAGAWTDDDAGVSSGAAYVFQRTGTTWTQQAKLVASDAAAQHFFGASVAIEGDTIVVGADYADTQRGAVYVFTRSGTTWTQRAKLIAPDGAAADQAGYASAISGDTIVVGAWADDAPEADRGSAYVWIGSGASWTMQQKLTATGGVAGDRFGWSVDIDGDRIAIGAPQDDGPAGANQGAVYTFTRSGGSWTPDPVRYSPLPVAGAQFGNDVEISGQTVVAGSPFATANAVANAGRVFALWPGDAEELVPSGATEARQFGASVAVDGETVIVGAPNAAVSGNANAGLAFAFERVAPTWIGAPALVEGPAGFTLSYDIAGDLAVANDNGADKGIRIFTRRGDTWSRGPLVPSFGVDSATGVATNGDVVFLGNEQDDFKGVDAGEVRVFTSGGGLVQALYASDAKDGHLFGFDVAADGDFAVIGAPGFPGGGANRGAIYIFERIGGVWTEKTKLEGPSSNSYLGYSVDISGDTVVAGAPLVNGNQGKVFVYRRNASTGVWTQEASFSPSLLPPEAYYGYSVAIDDDLMVVGAPLETVGGFIDAGSAEIFRRDKDAWSLLERLTADTPSSGDLHGLVVAASGRAALITSFGGFYLYTVAGDDVMRQPFSNPISGGVRIAMSSDTIMTQAPMGAIKLFPTSFGDAQGTPVRNHTALTNEPDLPTAAANADDFHALGAAYNAFETTSAVTTLGRTGVDIASAAEIRQPFGAVWDFSGGAALEAAAGRPISLHGDTTLALNSAIATSETVHNTRNLVLDAGIVQAQALENRGSLDATFGFIGGDLRNTRAFSVHESTQVTGDFTNRGTTTLIDGASLTVAGAIVNTGAIVDTATTTRAGGSELRASGDLRLGAGATLLPTNAGSLVSVGGDFDSAINSNTRYDMTSAELRLDGSAPQTLEVMSTDIGPTAAGLNRTQPGHYPIDTLRIGPSNATVALTDAHDNDGLGQGQAEAIYVRNLRIDAGTALVTNTRRIYYETLTNNGSVDNPANLIPIAQCQADFNGDGLVNGADLGVLLGSWGLAGTDLNGDGTTNGADLGLLLGAWGACP